jgi:hypothetical protein
MPDKGDVRQGDDSHRGQQIGFDDQSRNGLRGKYIVNSSTLFSSGNLGVWSMAVDKDVNQVMAFDKDIAFPVIIWVLEP